MTTKTSQPTDSYFLITRVARGDSGSKCPGENDKPPAWSLSVMFGNTFLVAGENREARVLAMRGLRDAAEKAVTLACFDL